MIESLKYAPRQVSAQHVVHLPWQGGSDGAAAGRRNRKIELDS